MSDQSEAGSSASDAEQPLQTTAPESASSASTNALSSPPSAVAASSSSNPVVGGEGSTAPPPATDLPPVTQFHRLDPASLQLDRLQSYITTAVVGFIGLVVSLIVGFTNGFTHPATIICFVAFVVIVIFLLWLSKVMPEKTYAAAGWMLTDAGLEVRRGIWWRSEVSVPLARVQHTDVNQGPMMRRFGLANLTVHTAGTENAAVVVNGLNFTTAQRLRDALIRNRGEIDGV